MNLVFKTHCLPVHQDPKDMGSPLVNTDATFEAAIIANKETKMDDGTIGTEIYLTRDGKYIVHNHLLHKGILGSITRFEHDTLFECMGTCFPYNAQQILMSILHRTDVMLQTAAKSKRENQ